MHEIVSLSTLSCFCGSVGHRLLSCLQVAVEAAELEGKEEGQSEGQPSQAKKQAAKQMDQKANPPHFCSPPTPS